MNFYHIDHKNLYCSKVSISFDYESSAITPKLKLLTKVKTKLLESGKKINLIKKNLSGRYGRGYANRMGGELILNFFNQKNIQSTWFAIGHCLLKGNKNKNAYRINSKLPYATCNAGFTDITTWRQKSPVFKNDPYSDYKRYPYYYLGDLTQKINLAGHNVQCHSFSHHYISMEKAENIRVDLEDWQNVAKTEGYEPAKIFAFPFLGDYHLEDVQTGEKIIPAFKKKEHSYKEVFLSNEILKVFSDNGIELFTRCGSMIDTNPFYGFKRYRNSQIYFIKDYPLLSFVDENEFKDYLDMLIDSKSYIDFWLHPNDIVDMENYDKFIRLINILVDYRNKKLLNISLLIDMWEKFKRFYL